MLSGLNTVSPNQRPRTVVLMDPLAMRRPIKSRAEVPSQAVTNRNPDADLFEGNPFAVASPFCNPDIS